MLNRRSFARILPFLAALPLAGKLKPRVPVLPLDVDERGILRSFDAHAWAKAFIAEAEQSPTVIRVNGLHLYYPVPDKETMLRWFANAICAGYEQGLNVDRRSGIFNELAADNERLRGENEHLRHAVRLQVGRVRPTWQDNRRS